MLEQDENDSGEKKMRQMATKGSSNPLSTSMATSLESLTPFLIKPQKPKLRASPKETMGSFPVLTTRTKTPIKAKTTAALFVGDLVKAGRALQGDMFHERYRQKLVKEFATIKELSGQYGAYATYLSGAGPTVMTLTPNDQAEALKTAIDGLGLDGETFILSVDKAGVVVDQKKSRATLWSSNLYSMGIFIPFLEASSRCFGL